MPHTDLVIPDNSTHAPAPAAAAVFYTLNASGVFFCFATIAAFFATGHATGLLHFFTRDKLLATLPKKLRKAGTAKAAAAAAATEEEVVPLDWRDWPGVGWLPSTTEATPPPPPDVTNCLPFELVVLDAALEAASARLSRALSAASSRSASALASLRDPPPRGAASVAAAMKLERVRRAVDELRAVERRAWALLGENMRVLGDASEVHDLLVSRKAAAEADAPSSVLASAEAEARAAEAILGAAAVDCERLRRAAQRMGDAAESALDAARDCSAFGLPA